MVILRIAIAIILVTIVIFIFSKPAVSGSMSGSMSGSLDYGKGTKYSNKSTYSVSVMGKFGSAMSGLLSGLRYRDWNGDGNLLSIQVGFHLGDTIYFEGMTGPGYIKNPDGWYLTTNMQYESTGLVGYRLTNTHELFVGYTHISNGRKLGLCFNSEDACTPNRGLDFIVGGLKYRF